MITTRACWLVGRSGAGRGILGRRLTGPHNGPRPRGCGVMVACVPTDHRWRVLGQLAADRGMPFVCVQPMQTSWARRSVDSRSRRRQGRGADRPADRAATLPRPEPVDETWGRLRHLGARRDQLIVEMVSQIQQMHALPQCVGGEPERVSVERLVVGSILTCGSTPDEHDRPVAAQHGDRWPPPPRPRPALAAPSSLN